MTNVSAFKLVTSFICLTYLITQFILIPQTIITADEFVFMRNLVDYTHLLPYRDFLPYKSTLGHYLIALPLFFSQAILAPIFYIKMEIACINTVCIAIAILWASQLFDKKAVLLTTLAILANQYSMFYMSDLRVDMLATWFCLFAALSILQQRIRTAGAFIGIAFLISQKALWYVLAINGAMCLCWSYSSFRLRGLLSFNSCAAAVIVAYLACWSLITSPTIVLSNFFYDAYIQASIQYYLQLYGVFWLAMLSHGPVLFLLWPFTFTILFDKKLNASQMSHYLFCITFAAIALILFINYKQAFPYNFVFTLPAFFICFSAFFTWLAESKPLTTNMYKTAFYIFFVLAGIILPFRLTWKAVAEFKGDYQQTMIQLTAQLTNDGSDYIAGVPLLYGKEQPIAGIKNLIGPQIDYLKNQSAQLAPLLLSSIYLSATTADAVVDDLKRSNVKVFITNYRTLALADSILKYIGENYRHYYGSIYLYAPTVSKQQLSFHLKFTANYRVDAKGHAGIKIDNKRRLAGQVIRLKQGDHLSSTDVSYRLVLIPSEALKLDSRYEKDEWLKTL